MSEPGPSNEGHILVYGLTALAVRIAEQLTLSGVPCLVLDDRGNGRAALRLRGRLTGLGVPTVPTAGTVDVSLREGDVTGAQAVVAAADSDIDNLEVALHAAEVAEGVRIVVSLNNARLGAELQEALPNARVLSLGDRAGPGFVEACIQSDVLHAFRLGQQILEVVDVTVGRHATCRELFGTLTPITLRRLDPDLPLELCPGRDTRIGPGDRISLLARPEDFLAHGIRDGDQETVDALVALSSGEMRDAPRPARSLRAGLQSLRASFLALAGEVDRPVRVAAGTVLVIMALSTVLLRFTYHNHSVTGDDGRPIRFGWLQALYFTTTIVATVGFGDFSFAREAGWLTAFGIFLILVGAAAVATLYALVTNFVLSQRLEQAFGRKRAITARGHIVVIGLGSIGLAVVEGLLAIGREVVVVEHDAGNRNLAAARARKVPVVIGDATSQAVLRQANIREAAAVAVMTSSDLANVESALSARAAHTAGEPDRERLRVVVRIFDASLAGKVQKRFGVSVVRSASALAAPWFVGAALGHEVISTFYAQRQPFLVARMRIRAGGGLDGTQLADMGGGLRVVAASPPEDPASAQTEGDQPEDSWPPGSAGDVGEEPADYRLTRHTRLQAGSEVLLVGTYPDVIGAVRANEPARV